MKRFLSLLLAVVLVLTLLPALSLRAEAKTGGKLIALTFDDGPSSKYTKQLLDGLEERGVPVTFFMLGQNAKNNRSLVKRAYEEGHEIACHTWDHPNLNNCSESKIKKQMEDTYEELDRACGDEADYIMRPPYGNANQKVRNAVDVPLIYWSVDSLDWDLLNTEKVRKKIVSESYDGCIILCHDIHKTTIPAALQAIDDLQDLGYEFVTVSELYRRRGVKLQDHVLHYNCKKNGTDYGPIPAPTVKVSGDSKGTNTVTITCSDKNVPLYYTLDGSYPNQDAKRYTGPFTVPYGTKVTAVAAYKLNGSRSKLTVKTADAIHIAAPAITLNDTGAVVMTTPTINSEIRFTVDNTKADANGLLYTGPEYIAGGSFLRAVTIHARGVSGESKAYLSDYGDLYYDMYAGQWFYDATDWAHRMGILNGTAPYTMDPGGIVNRGMLVTLLYRFSGDSLGEGWELTHTFKDVRPSYYCAEAIEWAYRNQIVEGYGADAFGPADPVTRQQMCKIVDAFLEWMETPLPAGESCADDFADYDQVAPWAADSVDRVVSAGLIVGDGTNLNPNANTNRAQFCIVLSRLADYIDNYVPEEPEEPTDPEPIDPEPTDPEPTDPEPTDPEPTDPEPTDPEPTDPEPTDPEPTDAEPTDPEPTDPEPTDPEPSEPEHVHDWRLNKALDGSDTEGDVSIDVGESFYLRLYCRGVGCSEYAPVTWTASRAGIVTIDGFRITGVTAGANTTLSCEWEGKTYSCIVRVRKQTNHMPEIQLPI